MNKNAIKKYAVWARRELIERVAQRAAVYGITADDHGNARDESIDGKLLTAAEKAQRADLIKNINEKGYEQVIEEVAYTWFNRFAALRFMEVNGYLPSHVRVFTNDAGEFKPQVLAEAIHLDIKGLDMDKVYELENANKTEELFKYLLIVQCNALYDILPGMFQRIDDYTELLLPDNLLREGSVIERMVVQGTSDSIPESDWTDQVQIIGWLYQYYNTEPKDKVFADLKKNIKITKENIPAATQLFTPDWIVHYMVENSLGRLWLEGHPNDALRSEWKYYLEEAEQEPDVQAQLEEIRKEYAALRPEEIKVIDPCSGSGHILCVLFDVLMRIYEDYGYTSREAVASIVEKNLWGLDIDVRAAQLSYFTVMMKARQYDHRFFARKDDEGNTTLPQPHVYAIEESNGITTAPMHDMGLDLTQDEYEEAVKQCLRLVEEMHDAKEYGSIINVTPCDWDLLRRFAVPRGVSTGQLTLDIHGEIEASARLQVLINIGEALSQKYHAVVTNPPYMNQKGMSSSLSDYAKNEFPNSWNDLSTVFMECCLKMLADKGYVGMINIPSWMFLSSFEQIRKYIVEDCQIINMIHNGRGIFGSDFGSVAFVICKTNYLNYRGLYKRLFDYQGAVESSEEKENRFFTDISYIISQSNISSIPGSPIAYWAGKSLLKTFENNYLDLYAKPCKGIDTGNNELFIRFWYEVSIKKFIAYSNNYKWVVFNKGGSYRKWYGNYDYVLNWENNGDIVKRFPKSNIRNEKYFFKEGITWTLLSIGGNFGVRELRNDAVFDANGLAMFPYNENHQSYLLALLNTKVIREVLRVISSTMAFVIGDIKRIPVVIDESKVERIKKISDACVKICRTEWDSFETSWDFKQHPFITYREHMSYQWEKRDFQCVISGAYKDWEDNCEYRFNKLKANEEELNRIFIDIYGMQDELTPEVEDKDVTVRKADLQRDIKSFISYAVGCMLGRYSLDEEGLVFAGGEWDESRYKTFKADKDGIIPICDDEYFDDDIVNMFVQFVEVVYGKDTLEENLRFIADALGGKGASRDVIRNYFLNDFYADHCKIYQKRPIYWLFDSGKKNGFKCLIYLHRYAPDTIARIRTDYVHEQQSRYRTAIAELEQRVNGASGSERVKLNKQLTKLQDQAAELRGYEEKIHHLADQMISIDLDDGVKVNYEKFKDVLAKIK